MSKITFRADADLVERVEALDASKSEVMRDALRSYLDGVQSSVVDLDALEELVAEEVDHQVGERLAGAGERDVNVNIAVETDDGRDAVATRAQSADARSTLRSSVADAEGRGATGESGDRACGRCGEPVSDDHVYCPNCGEKAIRRLFCECGDELRSDWAYCPGCGRRTPTADVLDG